jgi:exodeoxyribonuclease VII small subunit
MPEEVRPVEQMSFKEASIELERIVRSLEAGDLELEDSLERYGRGVELLASLRERLAHAEQRVQELVDQAQDDGGAYDTTAAPATAYLND